MKKSMLTLFLLLTPLVYGEAPKSKVEAIAEEEVTIRVLLESDILGAILEVRGPYAVIRQDKKTVLSSGNVGKRFAVQAIDEGLRWGEEYPDVFAIRVIPRAHDTRMFVDGMQYTGAISIYCTEEGRVTLVNEVPLEDYLKSTLAASCESSLSGEALAAVVIGARTLAYKATVDHKNDAFPWDVTAKETGYLGYGVIYQKNGVEAAVDKTRHLIVMDQAKLPADIKVSKQKAEELAATGMDAREILRKCAPTTSMERAVK